VGRAARERRCVIPAPDGDPDATLTADPQAWAAIAKDAGSGVRAFRTGRLAVRRNLHVGSGERLGHIAGRRQRRRR
jgi:hypothetical protein